MRNDQGSKLELISILEALPDMSEEEIESVFSRLEELGIDIPDRPNRRPGIQCPVTELALVAPCFISECPYQIPNEWYRNCILDYIDTKGGEEVLSIEEIAFLHNEPPQIVNKIIEEGMSALRKNSIMTMGFEGDFIREKSADIKANLGEDDNFKVIHSTLSPPFMQDLNDILETIIESDLVHKHPAVRLLGILDSIINEL